MLSEHFFCTTVYCYGEKEMQQLGLNVIFLTKYVCLKNLHPPDFGSEVINIERALHEILTGFSL